MAALRWQNQWGASLKVWQKQYDEGRQPPRQFFERPEIEEHLQDHWLAFCELGSERQMGMGVGLIPRSILRAYVADELGLTGDAFEQFCATLHKVDDDYVSMVNSPKTPDNKNKRSEVPVDDAEGVRALLGRLDSQKRKPQRKASAD